MTKKIIVIAAIVTGLIAGYFFVSENITTQNLRNVLYNWRKIAPMMFVLMHSVRPFTLLPSSILIVLGSLYFQFWTGLVLNLIGVVMGMTAAYSAGKILGHDWLVSKCPASKDIIEKLNASGWSALAAIRLIPLFPADLISYASGVCNFAYMPYIIGSIVGSIPGLVVLMTLGRGIRKGEIVWLLSLLPLLIIATVWIWKKTRLVL